MRATHYLWSMVATAYHQGEGTVKKALKKAKKTGNNDWLNNGFVGPKGRDYFRKFSNIQLTGETQLYQPKLKKKGRK